MPILTCIYFTFNWVNLTSEMHFVKFHPEVASSLLSEVKESMHPWGWGYYENTWIIFWYTIRAVDKLTVPGGQSKNISSTLPHFPKYFAYFSSICLEFFPHFGPPGGRLAHPGRPWLCHCIPFYFTLFVIFPKLLRIWSWNFGFAIRKIWGFIWYQKIYYFRLIPGGWECDWHKGL